MIALLKMIVPLQDDGRTTMELKEALRTAVAYVSQIESLTGRGETSEAFLNNSDVAIEEVYFDDASDAWDVSVGFFRPWNRTGDSVLVPTSRAVIPQLRTIKTVVIDNRENRVIEYRPFATVSA